MDDERFWGVVALASREAYERRLEAMPKDELIDFYWTVTDKALAFDEDEFASQMTHHSEDGQADIAQWILLQGREFYEAALADPAKFPPAMPAGAPGWHLKSLAGDAFEDRFDGENIQDTEPEN